jgi:hypothetical protein
MHMRNIFLALFFGLIISLFIIRPASSYADWNGHDGNGHNGNGHAGNGHDYGHHGRSYIGVNFSVWPDNYYYGAPYYPSADEVLVSPPVYEPIVINGITYYSYDGSYYVYNGYSYQPVVPPVTVVQQPENIVQPPAAVVDKAGSVAPVITTLGGNTTSAVGDVDSITINIPNNKGGYTAVTLKRSGNGFIGPQGEFYPEFPKVAQLVVIYGK